MEKELEPVTRVEFTAKIDLMESEHARMRDEDARQNKRIDELEESVKTFNEIAASIKEMAVEMKHIREDVASLSGKVDEIEKKPAKRWDSVIAAIIGAIVGGAGSALVAMLIGG